jgi:hypothetical protein
MIQHEQATCRSMKIVNLQTKVGSSVITPLDPITSAHIQCTLWLFYPFFVHSGASVAEECSMLRPSWLMSTRVLSVQHKSANELHLPS